MANSSHKLINIDMLKIDQVCIVVRDLDKSMESMWNTFGIGPWNIHTRDSKVLTDATYHGKPARFVFKVARTQNKLGGAEIELIEPVEGDNIYSDFLKEHEEGIHHLGWYYADSLEFFTETTRTLEKAGFPCIMSGRHAHGAFAYFDTTKVLNTVLEMRWVDASKGPRLPQRVFPE